MCGICGIVTNNPIPYDITGKMCKALTHRGPDGEGRYSDDDISIAMRRLSIIDLNNGWQPLYNEDGTIVLIINGEIYNYVELRKDLEDKGHLFTTKTDGEVILHLYEEYGTECVNYLRGMFAFGIRDIKRNQLILARDRMGEKPLYLYESDNLFLFSSEMKSLLTSGIISFELNPDSVNLFFHYQYVPEPLTLIKNIRKLPKGCILIINTKTMDKTEYCYWKMESAPILTGNPIDEIRKILDDISNIVIRSDVPVGIALSGGLDSSLVAALTAKKYPDTMQAFSIGYPGLQACDERADAEVFAEYIGMPFNDIELNTSDLVSFFPELVYHQDDPIADISGYGYYSVMKLAKEHNCPVMLQGQGGDELFFGYSWLSKAVQQSLRKQKNKTQDKFCINDYYKFKFPDIRHPISCIQYIKNYGGLKIAIKELKRDKTSPDNQLVFMDLIPDFQVIEEKYNTLFTKETINKIDKTHIRQINFQV